MKSIGILLIVYGHFFSYGARFVYIFSVPLFFLISGFLSKQETDINIFWKKIWFNLAVPMIIIVFIGMIKSTFFSIIHNQFNINQVLLFPLKLIVGDWRVLEAMWFVYTLIILKIILQYCNAKIVQLVFGIVLLIIGYCIDGFKPSIMDYSFSEHPNAILNVCMAFPFFIIGYWLKGYKTELNAFNNTKLQIMSFVLCLGITVVCSVTNDYVWMYENLFGNDLGLFLIGGCSGTFMIFIISKWLEHTSNKWAVIISNGTIVILGFHGYFIMVANRISSSHSIMDIVFSFVIIILFIPIIRITEAYFPYLIGKYRIKHNG